jgi:hypothetical protein
MHVVKQGFAGCFALLLSLSGMRGQDTNASFAMSMAVVGGGSLCDLAWPTQPGLQYTLQKSTNLVDWTDVLTLVAQGDTANHVASIILSELRVFWRVVRLGAAEEPVAISPVIASYQVGEAVTKALVKIVTGGTQIVTNVIFFDHGVFLGQATPSLGNTWTFGLVWDGRSPQPRTLSARAITTDGTILATPAQTLLLADPSQFVPLKPDGSRDYGQFVVIDSNGKLAPFHFFPEGLGGAVSQTGAHFEFPDGAILRSQTGMGEIEFTSALFYRGRADTTPLAATAGTHRLSLDAVTPSAVTAALGLPSNVNVPLLWGRIPVAWLDGELGGSGWAGLKVRLPIGEFSLPQGQEFPRISVNPNSGDPALTITYFGEWVPFPGGPIFRIPRSEPLKLYLSLSGRLYAQGTVETAFSSGATVRGSVAWRDPYFELRFQGRNIVIQALSSLKRALPANPELCAPAGSTVTELDAAAKCLSSFRDVYRGLALGTAAQVDTTTNVPTTPLPEPLDSVGTALSAWASRLASWTTDRAGQVLDPEMITDLGRVVENAAKTGESANDLATVLKLLRDTLIAGGQLASATTPDTESGNLGAQFADAQARLVAAAERITGDAAAFEPSAEFAEAVARLGEVVAASSPPLAAPRIRKLDPKEPGSVDLHNVVSQLKSRIGPNFALRVLQAVSNQGLDGLASGELLAFLEELTVYQRLLGFVGSDLPPGVPTLAQVVQAAQNVKLHFVSQSDAGAIAANTPPDYLKLRDVVSDRGRFFALTDQLGLTMASDQGGFFVSTASLIQNFAAQFTGLPFADRPRACRQDLDFGSLIAEHTSDHGTAVAIQDVGALVDNCIAMTADALRSSAAATGCDELAQALIGAHFTIAPRDPAQEGDAFPDVTGRYESVDDRREKYITLQLNQGGRYLQGAIQLQEETSNGNSARYLIWKIEGLFLRQTQKPGRMEFGLRTVNTANNEIDFLSGTSERGPDGNLVITLSMAGQEIPLTQISRNGLFSDAILEAFEPGQRGALKANQQTPMHTRIIARTAADVASLTLTLDRYFSDSASALDEQAAAQELQDKLQRIDRRLTAGQRPIAASLMRRLLSSATPKVVAKSRITGNSLDFGNQAMLYWDLLLALTLREHLDLSTQLGLTAQQLQELQNSIGHANFHYEMIIFQSSATVGDLVLSFGAGELAVTINKFSPDGQLLKTFELTGHLGSYDPALSPLPASCTITTSTNTFDSPFDFSQSDFEGPFEFGYFSVNAAAPSQTDQPIPNLLDTVKRVAGLDPRLNTWAVGFFEVDGSGSFPAMTFVARPTFDDPKNGFQVNECANVGLGLDVGGGKLSATTPSATESLIFKPGEIVPFDTSARPHLQGGVFFEINGFTLTECGWQYLREFVAENHELFVGTKSKIQVHGHTDAAGGGAFNQQLSEARANSVKQALVGLLHPSLRTTISAIGHGESEHDAALGIGPDTVPAPNDALFRRADILVGGVVKGSLGAPITPQP